MRKDLSSYYSYKNRHFEPNEKKEIDSIFAFIEDRLQKFKIKNFLDSSTPIKSIDEIDFSNVTIKQLKEISNDWPKLIYKIENINFKIEIAYEYKAISQLISESQDKIKDLNDVAEKLKTTLSKEYSDNISRNSLLSNIFSYAEFKKSLELILDEGSFNLSTAQFLEKEDIFQYIRRLIITDRSNLQKLMGESSDRIVHISEIEKESKSIANLLSIEFYHTLTKNSLSLDVPYGKMSHTEIVRPSHALASKLKLKSTEIGIFTVSLFPVANMEIDLGDQLAIQSLCFEVVSNQESSSYEMFYQLKMDRSSFCNLQVPVYYSFIRAKLIREQRTAEINENAA